MTYSYPDMSDQLERGVSSLIERLHETERELEATYLSLGELFPKLVAETDASARTAGDSLAAIRQSRTGTGKDSAEDFLASASSFFRDLRERDKTFLASVNAGIERIAALDEIIARVRTDSEEMEIVSLNALTAALKSGSAGRGFSVITDELKQISFKTISVTEDISAQGRKLLESFRSLGAILTDLDALQERFFEEIRGTLSEGFSALDTRVQEAAAAFGTLSQEAAGVRNPILGIMQGVQVQDILRQSIDHVILSLREVFKDPTVSLKDELVFTAAVADLSVSVLADVIERIREGVSGMGGHVDEVVKFVEDLEVRRQRTVSICEDFGIGSGEAAGKAETYLALKGRALAAGRSLSEQVRQLNDSFRVLASLLGKFQNIVVASRIEIARTRALSVVSNTVAGMIEITESLGRDVGQATDLTKTFIKTASAEILAYDKVQERNDERLALSVRRMEDELRRLESSRERVREAIASFRLYTPQFLDLIRTARASLDRLARLKDTLELLQKEIETLKRRASLEAEGIEGGGDDLHSIRNDRLRRMVERFTIFTHKKTAGVLGDFAVEEGVESGEVTLF